MPDLGTETRLSKGHATPIRRNVALLILFLTLATTLVAAIGTGTFWRVHASTQRNVQNTLITIAEQKRLLLERMLAEMRSDASLFASGSAPLATQMAGRKGHPGQQSPIDEEIRSQLNEIAAARHYATIAVFDLEGTALLVIGMQEVSEHQLTARAATEQAQPQLIDLHSQADGATEFGVIVPIVSNSGGPSGALYLARRAAAELYPMVQTWPVPTETSESLLVRPAGNEDIYVSPLRHQSAPSAGSGDPYRSASLAVAPAELGHPVSLEHRTDYRGARVLAYRTPVGGTPWSLITKIDEAEAYAGLRSTAWNTAVITGLTLLLTYLVGYLAWGRYVRQHHRARQESERRLMQLTNTIGAVLWELDADTLSGGTVSASVETLVGYPPDSCTDAKVWLNRIMPGDRPAVEAGIDRARRGEQVRVEYRMTTADDRTVWLEDRFGLITEGAGRRYLRGVATDITDRKHSETALAESSRFLQTVIDAVPSRVFWKDQNLRYLGCNPAFARDAGELHPQSLIGKEDSQLCWKAQAERYRRDDREVMDSGIAKVAYDEPQTTADGKEIWLRTSKVPLRNSAQEVVGVLGIYDDITEQKQSQEALLEASFFLKESQLIGQLGGWRADLKRKSVMWTEGVYAIVEMPLDYEPDLVTGLEFYLPEWRTLVMASLHRTAETGEPFTIQVEVKGARSGAVKWAELRGFPHYAPSGETDYLMGTLQDITARRDAELALRRESELRRRMTESLPGVFYLFDKSGRFISWNKNFERISQLSPTELAHIHPLDLFEGKDKDLVRAAIQRTFETGQGSVEARMVAKDGSKTFLYLTGLTIEIAGEVALIGTGVDISARKAAEAELEQYREHLEAMVAARTVELRGANQRLHDTVFALESVGTAIFWTEIKTGRVLSANHHAAEMLGYTPDELLALTVSDIDIGFSADEHARLTEEIRRKGFLRFDTTHRRKDGSLVPVEMTIHYQAETELSSARLIGFGVDITDRKAVEQAREKALAAAENLARLRQQFLANMSHEIRTPLNGVLGFAEIGIRSCRDSDKALNAFNHILLSGKHLLGVVNDILDFSKIEQGKLTVEELPVNVSEVIDEAVAQVQERARAKGLSLSIDKAANLPDKARSDPLRLRQILNNLLSNAVKFTETGSVSLSASREGDALVFEVADTGIGMTSEQVSRLFQPFEQADGSISRKYGGTGLGLAINERLVSLMGGSIKADSIPGAGSCFTVTLPYLPATDQKPTALVEPAAIEGPHRPPLLGIRVLLAEDNEINRAVAEDILRNAGADLAMVFDGSDAVQRVVADGPDAFDVILMDLQMPGMDGFQAAEQILAIAPNLPIIALTAHTLEEERARCIAAGMVAHVAKPFLPQSLIETVRAHGPRQTARTA